ncbi:ExbD/TolR family protein [Coraliomargarita parva]|uniref:ExbD/TolR family protein n=1 Tax=Coraliomargarita parva TaxID=3014050 RepID=UPI0022B396C0|nr:biopolymer transporter ExbD [Coraliomargarita parva]
MSLQGYKVPQDTEGFDLTPMIDIVFLLIVFFMTVASMITEKKDLNLAVADESVVPKEISNRYTFSIDPQGVYYTSNKELTEEQLRQRISKIVAEHGAATKLVLRVDRKTEHRHVNQLLQICTEYGITDIIFATYETDL